LLPLYPTAGSNGGAEQPQLTQHLVDSSISQDSDTGSADAPTSKPAGSVLKQLVLATPKQSSYSLYGSHAADGTTFTAQQLQEWPVQDCKDYMVSIPGSRYTAGHCIVSAAAAAAAPEGDRNQ
jgi:hypothetical protein